MIASCAAAILAGASTLFVASVAKRMRRASGELASNALIAICTAIAMPFITEKVVSAVVVEWKKARSDTSSARVKQANGA